MEVVPERQSIDRVFGHTRYLIDFYQRDYRWSDEEVGRLLDDIFYRFREAYSALKELDANRENVASRYPWYYLNTYVTNSVDGRVYVVDGQQRLTTLSLILIKLHELSKSFGSDLSQWIDAKIAGHSGYDHHFWITHADEVSIQDALYAGKEPPLSDGTTRLSRTGFHVSFKTYMCSRPLCSSFLSAWS